MVGDCWASLWTEWQTETTETITFQQLHWRVIIHKNVIWNAYFCYFFQLCLCVCLSVFTTIQAITFEPLHIETSFLVYRYIFTISRSSIGIKVIGSRSRSYEKNDNFTYLNMLILCIWLHVISKVKVTHQGEGDIKVKVKYLYPFKFYVACNLCKWVVCIRLKCILVLN